MASYRLTLAADRKIAAIYEYSVLAFGEGQADSYVLGLHARFESLANHPFSGREDRRFGHGVRSVVYKAHVIFYRPAVDEILIIDIFGMRQSLAPADPDLPGGTTLLPRPDPFSEK